MTFEQMVNEQFNGDVEAALKCLAHEEYTKEFEITKSREIAKNIITELKGDNAKKYMSYIGEEMEKNPKILRAIVDDGVSLGILNLTYEEVKNAEVNPYKAKIGKAFLMLLIGGLGLVSFAAILNGAAQTGIAASVGSGLFTLFSTYAGADLADKIVKYFYFKKMKKKIDKKEKEYEEGGKTL